MSATYDTLNEEELRDLLHDKDEELYQKEEQIIELKAEVERLKKDYKSMKAERDVEKQRADEESFAQNAMKHSGNGYRASATKTRAEMYTLLKRVNDLEAEKRDREENRGWSHESDYRQSNTGARKRIRRVASVDSEEGSPPVPDSPLRSLGSARSLSVRLRGTEESPIEIDLDTAAENRDGHGGTASISPQGDDDTFQQTDAEEGGGISAV